MSLKIEFIPQPSNGKYELWIDGRVNCIEISPEEALEAISGLNQQKDSIEEVALFLKAIDKINLQIPDPLLNPGNTQLLFIEGEVPRGFAGKELRVYDRVAPDGSSFILFSLVQIAGIDINGNLIESPLWSFYIGRGTKEIGKLIGYSPSTPLGETRTRILETLIQRLGRDIKIMI